MATKPSVDRAVGGRLQHVRHGGERHELAARPGRAGVSSACSVNVPSGPRKPIARRAGRRRRRSARHVGRIGRGRGRPATSCSTTWPPGEVDVRRGGRRLARLPFADLGYTRIDHHRALRQGMAEAVYGPGKTAEECAAIVAELLAAATRPGAADAGLRASRPRRCWPPQPGGAVAGADGRLAAARPSSGRERWSSSRRGPPTARGRGVRRPCCAPTACARAARRRRRGRPAPAAGPPRHARGRRRRRRRGRAWRARWPAWSAASRRPGRGRADRAGYGAVARRRHRAAGDAGLVRRRRDRGRHRQRLRRRLRRPAPAATSGPAGPDRRAASPGSTASPGSPATWRSARCSTPAPTSTRSRRVAGASAWTAGRSTPSRPAGGARRRPGPSCTAARITPTPATFATSTR